MARRGGWTDQDILIIALAGLSLAWAAENDPGFKEARNLNDEWFAAIQQYGAAVDGDDAAQLPACRAKLIQVSRKVFAAVNWGTVRQTANNIWLKEQLEGLGEQEP